MNKAAIITGCGRSGTLYMRKYFSAFCMDVGHERYGLNGISSWYLGFKDRRNSALAYYYRSHRIIPIHIVRSPLKVISSMRRCEALRNRKALEYFRRHYPQYNEYMQYGSAVYVAKWWVEWNKIIREHWPASHIFQIEKITDFSSVSRMCDLFGVEYHNGIRSYLLKIPTDIHRLKNIDKKSIGIHSPEVEGDITLRELYLSNDKVASQFEEAASNYGYSVATLLQSEKQEIFSQGIQGVV